jgi:hypothetical protein
MREVLDELQAAKVRSLFSKVIEQVKKSDFFAWYRYFKQLVVVSIDGVEHFSSQKVHCKHCLEKEHKPGEITCSHAMLAALVVYPDKREVLPLTAEPMVKQDGFEKNDSEG